MTGEELEGIRKHMHPSYESIVDAWVEYPQMIRALLAEVDRLRQESVRFIDRTTSLYLAIVKHRDAKGHDRCWENDLELYAVLGEALPKSAEMPEYEQFMEKCNEYYYQQKRCASNSLGKE